MPVRASCAISGPIPIIAESDLYSDTVLSANKQGYVLTLAGSLHIHCFLVPDLGESAEGVEDVGKGDCCVADLTFEHLCARS